MPNNKYKFGATQGRLTKSPELQRFPSESWQLEFPNASKLGICFFLVKVEDSIASQEQCILLINISS